jgi:uncharacterized coiled-coil DUF342 family protein
MSKQEINKKLMQLSERQDELREQMNKDHQQISDLKDKIRECRSDIIALKAKVTNADKNLTTYKNLMKKRTSSKPREEESSDEASETQKSAKD